MRLSVDQRDFARNLRRRQTDAENRIWYHLRGRRLCGLRFRRQHPVASYFADFACIEVGLIVELDGGQHASKQGQWNDCVRTDVLAAHGFDVLRFWDNDVLSNTVGVLAVIARRARQLQCERETSPAARAVSRSGMGE